MKQEDKLHTYLSLCSEYYDLDKPEAPKDELEFYMSYAKKVKGTILEPMCGTGRFLLPMVAAGVEVDGYDASDYMLQLLKEKAEARSLSVNAWKQFAEEKRDEKKYDFIFIPSGSLGLIIDDNKVDAVLKNMLNHLTEGGKFVFEVETLQFAPNNLGRWEGNIINKSEDEYLMISTLALAPKNNIGTVICRYELIESGVVKNTEVEKMQIRMYEPEVMSARLKNIGFSNVQTIKACTHGSSPDSDDEMIVFECEK